MATQRRIIVFDTTLRDGEQSPGASMTLPEKVEVATMLEELGVDVMEAGFPIASPGDFEAVAEVAKTVKKSGVCGLARCVKGDIDRAWEALQHAQQPRIHVFLATSPIHREFKLRMDKEQVLAKTREGIAYAISKCPSIEFSPEDGSRTEPDFLAQVVETAIDAGATTINIPDTVGYSIPEGYAQLIKHLFDNVPNIDRAVLSVHCHNDLGMAVANTLAAVQEGAGQVECTINGIGERAGNCALEEVVMALRTRRDFYGADTRIESKKLVPASRLVANVTGLPMQRNKAIVGRNAFAHESGIHQDGMLKHPETYEIMQPQDVGFAKTNLVLGKHSGRAAIADRAKELGYELDADRLTELFEEFKDLADKKKEVYDDDIRVLIEQQEVMVEQQWQLNSYALQCSGGDTAPEITVTLQRGDEEVTTTFTGGDGPIDAMLLAIIELTGIEAQCRDYRVHSVTVGRDALGEVVAILEYEGQSYRGRGVSTDCVEASAKAFLMAINRCIS